MHLPPPVHGAAMVGKNIMNSEKINSEFGCQYINLTAASSLEDVGRYRIGKGARIIRLYANVMKTLKTFNPDLVYVTPNARGKAFFKEYLIVEAIKREGFKVIVHYHNKGVSTKQDDPLYDALYRSFFKDLKVILLSEKLIPDIRKYVNPEDIFICPNGIEGYPVPSRCKEPDLLFLSNMLISKGVITLLDALAILSQRGEKFHCDFVGGETSEIDARIFSIETARRNLQNFVTYHGRQVGAAKEEFWQNASIFVFPSFYENECFPLVLLEAMQHSLPCIATDEGAMADIVEDGVTGLIVRKEDPEDLASKIATLLHVPDTSRELGEEGCRKYQDLFTMDRFEDRFISILKKCVSR